MATKKQELQQLAETFAAHFPEQLSGPRLIGQESEFPVVTETGHAADVRKLLEHLAETGDYEVSRESNGLITELAGPHGRYALEVGWGTVEVISPPAQDLHQLIATHEKAMEVLFRAARKHKMHILGYGIQPKTPGSLELMSPKPRYGVLHDAIGAPWLSFTATASEQVHIDIQRDEVVLALNLGNLLTPVLIALCANSPVCAGTASGYVCSREGLMGQIQRESKRHGMIGAPVASIYEWIERTAAHTFLTRKQDGEYVKLGDLSFAQYAEKHGANFEDFLVHDHYIWNSARARTAHGTIELRPACQQPWDDRGAVSAFGLGLLESGEDLYQWLQEELGAQLWPEMVQYGERVIAEGLAAKEPIDSLVEGVLEWIKAGLEEREKGEEIFLEPLLRRLEANRNPGRVALDIYESQKLEGLLKHLRIEMELPDEDDEDDGGEPQGSKTPPTSDEEPKATEEKASDARETEEASDNADEKAQPEAKEAGEVEAKEAGEVENKEADGADQSKEQSKVGLGAKAMAANAPASDGKDPSANLRSRDLSSMLLASTPQRSRVWWTIVAILGVMVISTGLTGIAWYWFIGYVTTVAGAGEAGHRDGKAHEARLYNPRGLAMDAKGNLFISDSANHRIRKLDTKGRISTIAGSGRDGYADGDAKDAMFFYPMGMALTAKGALIVADSKNHCIRKIQGGQVTTLAGDGRPGAADGPIHAARFRSPQGLAVGPKGRIFVADTGNHRIRVLDLKAGQVRTLAGKERGFQDSKGKKASFDHPKDVALHPQGFLVVADAGNHRIRKVTLDGFVMVLAGSGAAGRRNGQRYQASFNHPSGLTVTAQGRVFVTDEDNHLIRAIDANGRVSTFAGTGDAGARNGPPYWASFSWPTRLVSGPQGNLYVADWGNDRIRKVAIRLLR